MLTPDGARDVLTDFAARAVSIRVTDGGDGVATTVITEKTIDGAELSLQGEFESEFANFEWSRYEVLDADGRVLDAKDQDMGRKAAGSIWEVGALIRLPTTE